MPDAAGPGLASLGFAALCIAALLASGWWTNRTYRRFDRLPGHYDLTGKATRMDPRRTVAWLLPVIFSLVIALMIAAAMMVLPEMTGGEPSTLLYVMPGVLVAAQASVLHMLRRWASTQP